MVTLWGKFYASESLSSTARLVPFLPTLKHEAVAEERRERANASLVAYYLLPKVLSVDTLVDCNEIFLLAFTIIIAFVLPLPFLYFRIVFLRPGRPALLCTIWRMEKSLTKKLSNHHATTWILFDTRRRGAIE